jgi:hypothetical protein
MKLRRYEINIKGAAGKRSGGKAGKGSMTLKRAVRVRGKNNEG